MEDLEGEIWKPIIYKGVDYTGHYEVSNMGRVKSFKNCGCKVLKASVNSHGYNRVRLYLDLCTEVKVHRLVFDAFVGMTKKGYHIDHINSEKQDNRAKNLRLITHRENISKEKTITSGLPRGVICELRHGRVQIKSRIALVKNEQIYLGRYKSTKHAAQSYKIALNCHNEGYNLLAVINFVDEYRISIGLKPIKRRVKN